MLHIKRAFGQNTSNTTDIHRALNLNLKSLFQWVELNRVATEFYMQTTTDRIGRF
jgi:hypothetical protein